MSSLVGMSSFSNWDVRHWLALHGFILFSTIFNTICIYYFYQLWINRTQQEVAQHFKIRHKTLFISHLFINYFWISILPTMIAIGTFMNIDLPLLFCITYFTISLKLLIWCNRMWSLYWSYSFSSLQIKMIWKKQLNADTSSLLLKYPKLGQKKYIFAFTSTLMFTFDIFLFVIAYQTNFDETFHVCISAHFFIWTLLLNFLGIRLHRKHNIDNYNIREEFTWLCILFSSDFAILVAPYFYVSNQYIRIWIIIDGLAICNLVMIILTIKLILKHSTKTITQPSSIKHNVSTLIKLLHDPVGLNSFAEYLVGEFAVESLLFIIEVCQFRKSLKERISEMNSECKFDDVVDCYFELPHNIPLTQIMIDNKLGSKSVVMQVLPVPVIHNETTDSSSVTSNENGFVKYNFEGIVNRIYEKYIVDEYSEFSVNISFGQRVSLKKEIEYISENKMDINDLYHVYDDSFFEILKILRDPLSRFQRTETYTKWYQYYEQQQHDDEKQTNVLDLPFEMNRESIGYKLHIILFMIAVFLEKRCCQ